MYKVAEDVDCEAAVNDISNGIDLTEDAFMSYFEMFLDSCDEVCLTEEYARYSGVPFHFEENVDRAYLILKRELNVNLKIGE